MIEAFFSDAVNISVSIVFFLGMAVCAILIPMTVRRTRELKEQNDHRHALAMQKRWRPTSRPKRMGRHSLRHTQTKNENQT